MLNRLGRSGYDPVARRRHRRLLARARPLLLPGTVLLAVLLLGGRLVPVDVPAAGPVPVPPRAPAGHVLVVVTPADPAVLGVAVPGAVVDVYGTIDPMAGLDGLDGLVGSSGAPPTAGRLVAGALVVGPRDGAAVGRGPDPPGGGIGAVVPGPAAATSVVLAVTDEEARALAGQEGRGLSLAVRSGLDGVPEGDHLREGGG